MTASNHRPAGSGDSRPASAAAPGSAPAREGGHSRRPGADRPRPSTAEALALVVKLALSHSLSLRHFASPGADPCAGLARAWREPQASALEAVEKVVTRSR